jgi:signal transduction histidine kinase/CheY-like chemotaxis protein
MIPDNFERELQELARILSEIAHTLESVEDAPRRIERVLKLLNAVIPYRRCSLLELDGTSPARVFMVPQTDAAEQRRLTTQLTRVFRVIAFAEEIGRPEDATPNLTLPVIGLDAIVGVIRVEPATESYTLTHLRILSVVAAQLGAYLTTLRLREIDRKHVDELAAAHAFQQRLAGIVSHDLRNPLSVISTAASHLLERATDEHQIQALRRAQRNAEHATRLIADLLDVTESRVTGTIRITPRNLNVVDLVRDCIEDLRTTHPRHTIELISEIDAATEATWDRDRILQVLMNLVGNAVAHGAPEFPVRVVLRSSDDTVTLSVHNFGPPIPSELQPQIFDPFHHGAQRPHPQTARGLGLGLYIVAQIVRAHGGTIEVVSSVGRGTSFIASLPRRALAAEPATTPSSMLVMVVDDDPEVRIGMTAVLSKRGYTVQCAEDGAEALKLLRGGLRPSLVVLDVNMPRMDGPTLWRHCQNDPALADIQFVVITGDATAAVKLDRARAVLPKPVSVDRLLATLRAVEK